MVKITDLKASRRAVWPLDPFSREKDDLKYKSTFHKKQGEAK